MVIGALVLSIHALFAVAAVILLLQATLLLVEVIAGLANCQPLSCSAAPCSYVVVIPAHDEVGTIEQTLASVVRQIGDRGRILVVADNCTDATADVSREAGAEVLVRDEPMRRGKGFALAFAIRHLASMPPGVVIILDADCIAEPGAIEQLVGHCHSIGRPVQARYELTLPETGAGPNARIGMFAWRVKNILRPAGLANLGMPCLLMGTGMAFPWGTLAKANLDTGHLVEDMVLGLELTAARKPPLFLTQTCVRSSLPPSSEGQTSQRARWETGHIQVISQLVPRFLAQGIRMGNLRLVVLSLDTALPPLALFTLLIGVTVVAAACLALIGGPILAFQIGFAGAVTAGVTLLIAWHRVGRDLLSPTDVMILPGYVFSKLSIYLNAIRGSRLQWVRSKRN